MDTAIKGSVDYLGSEAGLMTLEASPYWPKWNQPWWHMLLLHEMGETARIPAVAIHALIDSLNRTPVKIFPIHPGEMPDGADPWHTACHCQLGNVYRVLDGWGVDVEAALPWVESWFLRYQMADGGLNCDGAAYRVEHECPSSMVGTIAAFEALTARQRAPWTADERAFLQKAAQFMIERRLVLGSASAHNAEEQLAAQTWTSLCFPRFYQYDVLRGLSALAVWAERSGEAIPRAVVEPIIADLDRRFADGGVRAERLSCAGHGTISLGADGSWDHTQRPPSSFALLDLVRNDNGVSPFLSRELAQTKARVGRLMRL